MKKNGPRVGADCAVFDLHNRVLLIRRKHEPFRGKYALPGGFMEVGETIEATALRELKEETGITAEDPRLIGVYSDPDRDPRGHTVSVAFLFFVRPAKPVPGDDAESAEFVQDWSSMPLAFDHNRILRDAVKLRADLHATLGRHG